jgi:hypothetical protein
MVAMMMLSTDGTSGSGDDGESLHPAAIATLPAAARVMNSRRLNVFLL